MGPLRMWVSKVRRRLGGSADQFDKTHFGTESPTPHTFGSLKVYNYRLYFIGQTISVAGNWMQNVAIGWLVLQLTHNGFVLGIVTATRFAPLLLLGPWGGLIADRSDRRRLLFRTQTALAVLSFVLAMAAAFGQATLPVVIAVVLGLGFINVLDNPTRQSLISSLVDRSLVGNAIALNSISMNGARVIGPAIGGALLADIGVTPCFFVNAISYVAVMISLRLMRPGEMHSIEQDARAKGQIRAGMAYVLRSPELIAPLVMVAITGAFAWEFPVSMPLVVSGVFHASAGAYGLAMTFLAIGSVGGGVIAARRRQHSMHSLSVSALLWGVSIGAAALAPNLVTEYVLLPFVGSSAITFNSMAKTLLQLQVAPLMRGRVMSLWSIAWQGSTVVGAPAIGAADALFGARWCLGVGAIACLAVGAAYIRRTLVISAGDPPSVADVAEVEDASAASGSMP